MRNYLKLLSLLGLQLLSQFSYAGQISISSLRYSTTSEQSRIQFQLSSSPRHRVFVQNNPSRLVIDIKNARFERDQVLVQPATSNPLFASARVAEKSKNNLRIIIDLKQAITPGKFSLISNNKNNHQFQVALINKTQKTGAKASVRNTEAGQQIVGNKSKLKSANELDVLVRSLGREKSAELKPFKETSYAARSARFTASGRLKKEFVIAIDAGHGGEDPGARGPSGIEEKKVVFVIAKKLTKLINEHPGMRAVMVRKGDYYVDLRKRMHIARKVGADLFISIHADAFPDTNVRGASVYTLSRSGASSEAARWLAKTENAADLMGGVSLVDKDDVLASVLLNLSQSATQQESLNLAKNVLRSFHKVGQLHKSAVQSAGFLVLKSPDIPSILVETAFISNPLEESSLMDSEQQTKIAIAIYNGVRGYIKQTKPAVDVRVASL